MEAILLIVLNGIETHIHRQVVRKDDLLIVLNGIETKHPQAPLQGDVNSFNRTKWN